MYAALWRVIPGPTWLRIAIAVALVAGVLAGLFFCVFPLVSTVLTPQDVTVG